MAVSLRHRRRGRPGESANRDRGPIPDARTLPRARTPAIIRAVATTAAQLNDFYQAMYDAYGQQHWWPGETPFEVMVGAVLTQNTAWGNVEKAITNLKHADMLDPHKIAATQHEQLAELIRPSGYFNIKAKRLKSLVQWFIDTCDGDPERLYAISTETLRESLLSIKGVGRETADSIALYAAEKPTFVVDAYTYRILYRHHLVDDDADYESIKELFESNLLEDVSLYNEYHALIVQVGKYHCKPKAKCDGCPLAQFEHDECRS